MCSSLKKENDFFFLDFLKWLAKDGSLNAKDNVSNHKEQDERA